MTDATTAAAHRAARPLLHLQAIAAFFLAIKLIYIFGVPPMFDEAYYWVWGQNPQLSYFDHPPFHGWLLGLSDLAFGRSLLSLRWMTLATMAGVFWIFADWAKRYAGTEWRETFWRGVVIYLASPTFGFFFSLAYHDYLLVFLCLFATHLFLSVLTTFRESGRVRVPELYGGAVLLGLAGLTKYNAVFLGLALLACLLASRPLRPLFRSVHLWLAGALAIAMQAPVLIWNLQHGFASFRFHLVERHPQHWLQRINPWTLGDFVFTSALLISPFLIYGVIRFIATRQESAFARSARGLAGWAFALSTATCLVISLFDYAWWWWNLIAYVPALPFLARTMGRRLVFYGHVALGAAVALYMIVSSAVFPIEPLLGIPDPVRVGQYGQELIAPPIRRAEAAYDIGFVAAGSFETASIAAFALDDGGVTALTARTDGYDFWFDAAAHAGQNAVVVVREGADRSEIERRFRSVRLLESVPVERFGRHLSGFDFLLGEGFIPPPLPQR